jgi:AbrB family looped-hinge helix DNA binding protein
MSVSTLTSKGQITIPKDVRERLQLHAGDKIEFVANNQNEFVIKPITKKVSDIAGLLKSYKKKNPVSIEEMNKAIGKQIQKEFL